MPSFFQPNKKNTRKHRLHRQMGEHNLIHGTQRRLWRDYVKNKRRNAANRQFEIEFDVQNLNDSNIENLHALNTSTWKVKPGNNNTNSNIPKNLLPTSKSRKNRKSRKTRKNRKSY